MWESREDKAVSKDKEILNGREPPDISFRIRP